MNSFENGKKSKLKIFKHKQFVQHIHHLSLVFCFYFSKVKSHIYEHKQKDAMQHCTIKKSRQTEFNQIGGRSYDDELKKGECGL